MPLSINSPYAHFLLSTFIFVLPLLLAYIFSTKVLLILNLFRRLPTTSNWFLILKCIFEAFLVLFGLWTLLFLINLFYMWLVVDEHYDTDFDEVLLGYLEPIDADEWEVEAVERAGVVVGGLD